MPIMTRLGKFLSSFGSRRRQGKKLESLCGMTTAAERQYLENYARRVYTGAGAIVDLGSWLGSLTIPLLVGLKQNPLAATAKAGLHAYDLFEWAQWMEPYQEAAAFEQPMKPGDSLLPEFRRRVCPHDPEKRLLVHAGDLRRLGWCGHNIELLIIDLMKSWELANCVVQEFLPFLIPGRSYVFHQDFCHYYTTWIHLIHYRLRDHFEKVVSLPDSATLVFKHTKPFLPESLRRNYSFNDFSEAEIEQAFDFSLSQIEPDQSMKRQSVLAAKVMAFIQKRQPATASRELDAIASSGIKIEGELKTVRTLLEQMPKQ